MYTALHLNNVPIILVKFSRKLNFLDIFSKNPKISNFMKSVQWEQRCSMRAGGQTDMKKLIASFRNYADVPKNLVQYLRHPAEHCFIWRFDQALPPGPSDRSRIKIKMCVEHKRSNGYRKKPKHSENNLPQYHSIYYNSHTDWAEIESKPPRGGRRLTASVMARPLNA
jgi:hypothetical protein